MTKTIGSFDLASLKNLRDDVTQYFWFESNSSSAWGSGAHVTLYPESQFTDSTSPNYMKGQNIIMNTDGFSIRNGGLPMMVLDNDSLDFNVVDTTTGTYATTATFTSTSAQIGQSTETHLELNANGFSILNGLLPMMTLDNDSLDFNVVDTIQGTYTTTATFGLNGVQIGADSTAHTLINTDGFSAYNAEGVKFLDADFDGGSITTYSIFAPQTQITTVTIRGDRRVVNFTVDIPTNIPSGTVVSTEKIFGKYIPLCGLEYKSGTQLSSITTQIGELRATYTALAKSHTIWYHSQKSFTIGTSKTIITEGTDSVGITRGNSEVGVTYSLSYDAEFNRLIGEIIFIPLNADMTQVNVTIQTRYGFYITTTAPSFTFGQRASESNNGNYSAIIGNGLIAENECQTILGKYNNNQTNTVFEIGNGNGISGDAKERSNALTVDWDGNVVASGSIVKDSNFNQAYNVTISSLAGSTYLGQEIDLGAIGLKHPIFNGFDISGTGTARIHTLGHYIYKSGGHWYAYIKMRNDNTSAINNFTVTAYITWI